MSNDVIQTTSLKLGVRQNGCVSKIYTQFKRLKRNFLLTNNFISICEMEIL